MKNLLIGLSFLILTFNAFALTGEVIYKKHSTSIIYLEDESGGHGTGFFIHGSGLIFTNKHVYNGLKKIVGKTLNNQYEVIHKVGVHPFADVALLRVDNIKPGDTYLKISNSSANVGEDVFLIGHPKDLDFRMTSGIISFKGRGPKFFKEGSKNLQYTAPTLPGSSGSPVLNREGEVIGIHSNGYSNGETWGVGIDPETGKSKWVDIGEQGYNIGWDKIYLEEMLTGYLNQNNVSVSESSEIVNSKISNSLETKNDLASLIRELKAYTPPEERKLGSL